METPDTLKYSIEHVWVKVDGSRAFVGITDYAQDSLGNIVFLELADVDLSIKAGETFGTVESVKATSSLYMPLSGTIVEINEELLDDPGAINNSPYDCWMVVVEMDNTAELGDLLDAAQYEKSIQN